MFENNRCKIVFNSNEQYAKKLKAGFDLNIRVLKKEINV